MKIALTGHRPGRLYTNDLLSPEWNKLRERLRYILLSEKCTDAYTGMADGSDIVFALAVCDLKNTNHHINLHCILPCNEYQCNHPFYYTIKNHANEWKSLSTHFYKGCDNIRDQYLVDHSDKLIAVWDGNKSGGVWGTICKARKQNLPIIYVDVAANQGA